MFGHVRGDLLKCLSDGIAFSWIRSKLEKQPKPIGLELNSINPESEWVVFRFAAERKPVQNLGQPGLSHMQL